MKSPKRDLFCCYGPLCNCSWSDCCEWLWNSPCGSCSAPSIMEDTGYFSLRCSVTDVMGMGIWCSWWQLWGMRSAFGNYVCFREWSKTTRVSWGQGQWKHSLDSSSRRRMIFSNHDRCCQHGIISCKQLFPVLLILVTHRGHYPGFIFFEGLSFYCNKCKAQPALGSC